MGLGGQFVAKPSSDLLLQVRGQNARTMLCVHSFMVFYPRAAGVSPSPRTSPPSPVLSLHRASAATA